MIWCVRVRMRRGDLMRARHRLSKLLLRHGLVYDASAWTLAHDAWLRRQRFESRPLALAFDECYGAVLQAKTRRDTLDAAIVELAAEPPFAEIVGRLCCLRGVSTLTALGLTVELGDWSTVPAAVARPVPRPDPERGLERRASPPGRDHEDRQHARPPAAGRGGLAPAPHAARERCARAPPAGPTGRRPCARRSERPPPPRPLARARRTRQATHDRRGRRRTRARRALLGAGDDGVAQPVNGSARRAQRRNDARSDPRYSYEQPIRATPDPRERHHSSSRTPGHAVPTRA